MPNYTMTTMLDGSSLPIYAPLNVYAMYFIPFSNHRVVDHPLSTSPVLNLLGKSSRLGSDIKFAEKMVETYDRKKRCVCLVL